MIKIKKRTIEIRTNDNKQNYMLEKSNASIIRKGQEITPSLEKTRRGMIVAK